MIPNITNLSSTSPNVSNKQAKCVYKDLFLKNNIPIMYHDKSYSISY